VLAAGQDIVVVTINYRLGGLGFFATQEATTVPSMHGATGGMNGLLDQITALRWVQANGARFGGDVSQITISGESAGGESVCNLLASPVAHGLFHRAIIESGPCLVGTMGWVSAATVGSGCCRDLSRSAVAANRVHTSPARPTTCSPSATSLRRR